MTNFTTILDDVGNFFKKAFSIGIEVAQVAEPFIDIVFPGVSVLYNTTVTAVVNAENAAIAAGQQQGTGAQKLALVVTTIQSDFNAYWKSIGNSTTTAPLTTIEAWVNGVVASLNAIPSVTASTAVKPAPVPVPQVPASNQPTIPSVTGSV